jgi:hypothetical protein
MVRLEQGHRVVEIVDKPRTTDLAEMWGCILWRSRFTEYLHECVGQQDLSDFAQIMNRAIDAGMHFRGIRMAGGTYIDLGTYEEVAELDRRFRQE